MNHDALRNSTAPVIPASRSRPTASSMVSRFSDEVKNQRGYWSRIEPSWPASLSGSSPSANHAQTSSRSVVRQVLRVEARLHGQLGRERLAQVLREPLGLGRLAGHQRMRLDVEGEVGRRALDPQLRRPSRRQGVVGRVDLDQREAARVVAQPLLGGVGVARVEDAGGGHRRVGPRRRSEADRAGADAERFRGDIGREVVDPVARGVRPGVVGRVEVGRVGADQRGRRLGHAPMVPRRLRTCSCGRWSRPGCHPAPGSARPARPRGSG